MAPNEIIHLPHSRKNSDRSSYKHTYGIPSISHSQYINLIRDYKCPNPKGTEYTMIVLAPISLGEYLDKISILKLKADLITQPDRRLKVLEELEALNNAWPPDVSAADPLFNALCQINKALWNNSETRKALLSK